MVSGTRPAEHIYKEKKFHERFGGVSPQDIPDFNLDAGLTMPDQVKDQADTECVGYTVADILTDIFKVPFSPDFSFAAARYVAGDDPGIDGTSFHAGIQSAVAFGGLIKTLAPFDAMTKSELYISDYKVWDSIPKESRLPYAQNGTMNVLGNGDAFDSILFAAYNGKIPVSVGSPWFEEWAYNIQGGVVQQPVLDGQYPNWHNYCIKGKKTINGVPSLIVKSWQGTRVGDNGWLYFSRETINKTLSVPGSGALTINPNGNRWIELVSIMIQRFPMIVPLLPQLLNANRP